MKCGLTQQVASVKSMMHQHQCNNQEKVIVVEDDRTYMGAVVWPQGASWRRQDEDIGN